MHLRDLYHWLLGFVSTFFLSAALTGGEPRSSVPVILNEYNAVGATNCLGGTASTESDTHFGRVQGNGGNWIELVVTQDHLDMRDWYIDWSEGVDTGRITFTNHALWSDLRAGTIITLIEQDTAHGGFNTDTTFNLITDWWINIATMSGTTPQTTYITTTNSYNQPGAFSVGNNNFQITIYNAAGLGVAFGPVGEGICNFKGVSSEEVGKLEADPSPSITPCSAFHDGTSSTFGAPNRWANGTEEQDFGALRGKIMDIELVALMAPSTGDGPQTTLPTSLSSVAKGSTFYMEIWAQTTENGGLSSVYTDVHFSPCAAHAVSITQTAAFSFFGVSPGTNLIDNVSGLLDNVGGEHWDPGCTHHFGQAPNWVRVSIVQMVADADGSLHLATANTGGGWDSAICGGIGVVDKNRVTYSSRDLPCGTASGQLLLTVPSAPQNVQVGGQVTVELCVADLTAPINGVQALLTWNPQNLSFVSATLSPPWNVQFLDPASPIGGNLAYTAGIASGATSANGVVGTLTFTTLATGTPMVSFLPDRPAPFPASCATLTKAAGGEIIIPEKSGMNQSDIVVAGTTMCNIDGVLYNDGDLNPENGCQECDPENPLVWSPKTDGTACDDALFCNGHETCQGGVCTDGVDPCVDQAHCDEVNDVCIGCLNNDDCDDGDACTIDECKDGACVHTPITVDSDGVLHVPEEYLTIQAAICAAQPGDEVVVADGIYTGLGNKDLDFQGKAITVRSASGDPAACVIDCQGSGRGFYFHSGETAEAVVRGFTIRNGSVSGSSPGGDNGGGVYCSNSSPTLTKCTISGNKTSSCYPSAGGGVYCNYSSPTLTNCTISGNSASRGGGMSGPGSTTLTNCTISGNTASNGGGGLFCEWDTSLTQTNYTITRNTASGGGVYRSSSSNATLTNCTISGNLASLGGGVYCDCCASPMLTNCILWGDNQQEIFVGWAGNTPVVTYCDIQGGWLGIGNVQVDPLFVDSDGPDNDPNTWQDNDYHLSSGSPCIDSGNNAAVPPDTLDLDGDENTSEPTPFDLDGHPRLLDDPATPDTGSGTPPIVDMGAYEYQGAAPRGDMNCDRIVDVSDVAPFVLALTDPSAYQLQYPGCNAIRADIDLSGTADGLDIQPFIELLCGEGPSEPLDVQTFVAVLLGVDADPMHIAAADMNSSGTADGADIQLFVDALLGP